MFVRGMLLALALGALVCSLMLRFNLDWFSGGSLAVSELMGRVGLVLLCGWWAWPTFKHIRSAPGGFLVLITSFVAAILFIARPKSALLIVPVVLALAAVASLLGWFRRLK